MLERSAEGCAACVDAGTVAAGLRAVSAAGLGEEVAGEVMRAAALAVDRGTVVGRAPAVDLGALAAGTVAAPADFVLAVVGSELPRGLLAPAGEPVGLGAVGTVDLGAAVGKAPPAGLAAPNELGAGLGATDSDALAGGMDERMLAEAGSASSPEPTTAPRTSMMCPHFLHLNFVTSRPRSFSSATWYFCLQFSQRKFMETSGTRAWEGLGDGHALA
jgi:hypothetical protein